MDDFSNKFKKSKGKSFWMKDGKGRENVEYSFKKLCFVATDQKLLANILLELSNSEKCYFVKFSVFPKEKMYLGRAFFLSDEEAGRLWAIYKKHAKLNCTIQDDTFTKNYR